MPMIKAAVSLYDMLQGSNNDRQVAWLIGQTGTGKSVALRHLRRCNPARTAYVIAEPSWKGNKSVILSEIAMACGVAAQRNAAAMMSALVGHLRAVPTTILLDEFHVGGVMLFAIIKALVNKAPEARFVLATMPSAYRQMRQMSSEMYEEACQLRGRSVGLIKKQWAGGVRDVDIAAYLAAAAPEIGEDERPALVSQLAVSLHELGLRLLATAVSTARTIAEGDDEQLTAEHITAAITVMKDEI